jgi:DNA-directed RNA polymerase specialized sigma24 family protein
MEGADPRTDGELLVATATDPEAFLTFYRRHVRGLLAFFRRRGASAEVALDLTAETFAAALEASPRYELRPEPARPWLYGIAWIQLDQLASALLAGSSHAEDEDPFRRQEALQAHRQRQGAGPPRVLDPHPREEDAQAQAASG